MADTKLSALTELAATPAVDDEVYIRDVSEAAADESKRITVANLMAGAGGTKEFFVPAHPGSVEANLFYKGDYGSIQLTTGYEAFFTFKVPHDFTSIVNAQIVIIPATTNGTANLDLASDYCALNSYYTQHSESNTASTYSLTANYIYLLDVSGVLSSLAADDLVGIKFANSIDPTETLSILGLRFKYN